MSITVTINDDGGFAVAGADVSIDLLRDGGLYSSAGGTTEPDGTVTFSANNAPLGCYETVVTDVTAAGLVWDGVTPFNVFCK